MLYRYDARPSDEEVTITRMLDKVLRRSDAIDKESLCILAGQRVSIVMHHISLVSSLYKTRHRCGIFV